MSGTLLDSKHLNLIPVSSRWPWGFPLSRRPAFVCVRGGSGFTERSPINSRVVTTGPTDYAATAAACLASP